jgi:phosphoenolpyruvate synthase/pyruvate phosphate dikinase
VPTSEDEQNERVLTSEEILAVARLGISTETRYGSPQKMEWAMAAGRTQLVRSLTAAHDRAASWADRVTGGKVCPCLR